MSIRRPIVGQVACLGVLLLLASAPRARAVITRMQTPAVDARLTQVVTVELDDPMQVPTAKKRLTLITDHPLQEKIEIPIVTLD